MSKLAASACGTVNDTRCARLERDNPACRVLLNVRGDGLPTDRPEEGAARVPAPAR